MRLTYTTWTIKKLDEMLYEIAEQVAAAPDIQEELKAARSRARALGFIDE